MMTHYYTTTTTTTTKIRRSLYQQQQHRRQQQQQQQQRNHNRNERKTFFFLSTTRVVIVSLLLPYILLLLMMLVTATDATATDSTVAIPNTTDNTYDNDNDNAAIIILSTPVPEIIIQSSFKQPPKQRNSQQQRRTVQQQQQQPNKQQHQQQEYNNNNYKAFISLEELQNAVDIVLEYRSTGNRPSFTSSSNNNNNNKKKQQADDVIISSSSSSLLSSSSSSSSTSLLSSTSTTTNTINDINDWYGPIELWNVSLLTDFTRLFNIKRNPHYVGNYNATYDLDLSLWNIGGDTSTNNIIFADMFYGCTYMNFNVGLWNTSKVSQFQGMFELTTKFQGIGLEYWDVSSGRMFMSMFSSATGLLSNNNLDLSNWKPGLAVYQNLKQSQSLQSRQQISFKNMFRDSSYNGNLCNWKQHLDPSKVDVNIEVEGMFSGSHCTNQNDPTFIMIETGTGGMNRNFIKKWDPTTSFCSDPCGNIDETESVVH